MSKFDPIPEKLFFRRISIAIILLLTLILTGTFVLLPKTESFTEAFIRSASQVTRIPFSGENAFIFFLLALFGYVLAFYIIYVSIEFALEGKFREVFVSTRMEKRISKLRNHCIVCGYGRVGENVVRRLKDSGKEVVVMDKNPEIVKQLRTQGLLSIEGTTEEEDLIRAGIRKARYLVTCLGDDGKNLLLIMAARELNPSIIIVSRASDEKMIKKMKYAGANYVVMPEILGGEEIVESILENESNKGKGEGFYKSH